MTLKEALQASDRIADSIMTGLKSRADIASLGLEILGVSIRGIKPSPGHREGAWKPRRARGHPQKRRRGDLRPPQLRRGAGTRHPRERAGHRNRRRAEKTRDPGNSDGRRGERGGQAEPAAAKPAWSPISRSRTNARAWSRSAARTPAPPADAEAYRVGALMKIFEGVDTKVIQALAASRHAAQPADRPGLRRHRRRRQSGSGSSICPRPAAGTAGQAEETPRGRQRRSQDCPGDAKDPARGPDRQIPHPAQAKFYVEHLGADFSDYQREHDVYMAAETAHCAGPRTMGTLPGDGPRLPAEFHLRPRRHRDRAGSGRRGRQHHEVPRWPSTDRRQSRRRPLRRRAACRSSPPTCPPCCGTLPRTSGRSRPSPWRGPR